MSLVSLWKFDENAPNGNVADTQGVNNATADDNTNVLHTTGKIDGAFYQDGTIINTYINCGHDSSLDLNELSISFWIKGNSEDQPATYPDFIAKLGGVSGYIIQFDDEVDRNMYIRIDTSAGANQVGCFYDILNGNWRHVVFTISGAGQVKLYADGEYISGYSYNVGNGIKSAATDLVFFDWSGANISLDDIRIYDNVLTDQEVRWLYEVDTEYITSATTNFLELQSGLARPYWEANITVSGYDSTYSGTLGQAYGTNDIINLGTIDRKKPVGASGLSPIFAGNMTMTLNNASDTYSPLATASIFTDAQGTGRDWLHSTINIWAGFYDTSGTAIVIQRGSFLLTQLRIDSHDRKAYFTCEDAAKVPLARHIGMPTTGGVAQPWTPTSGVSTKAIMSELLSAVGLTASQWDLASGLNFPNYSVEEEKVSDALSKLAHANDGYIYTNGKGQIVFKLNSPVFGGGENTFEVRDTTRICKARYSIDVKNLLNTVQVKYTSGLDLSRGDVDSTIVKGREEIIENETIDQASIAGAISSKLLGLYKTPRTFYELDNIWLPSVEIGDALNIYDTNTHQSGEAFIVYQIREDIVKCQSKFYTVQSDERKWGFCSDTSATNLTVDQSGGSEWGVSWHSGFAFASVSGTAFDDEGNNNNAITTGYFVPGAVGTSGTGVTGIELHFRAY